MPVAIGIRRVAAEEHRGVCEHLAAEGLGDPDGAPAERLELRGGLAGTGGGLLLELKRPDADRPMSMPRC